MAAALPLALALLGGCLAEPSGPRAEALPPAGSPTGAGPSSAATDAPAGPAGPAAPAPSPPPTIAEAGLSLSQCHATFATFIFKHEWAAGLVPPEYRMLNVQAGNLGEVTFQVLSCAGLAVGNRTFAADAFFGYLAVLVEAPPEVQGPSVNAYVLELAVDAAPILAVQAGAALAHARFFQEEDAFGFAGAAFAANVTELSETASPDESSASGRLHWKSGDARCWTDLNRTVRQATFSQAVFRGLAGSAAALAGPAGHLAGVGSQAAEDGLLSPPRCA